MPPPPRRPATRHRILEAASAEFAARGFAATGVDRIARRARVNKAMIYYHFDSKLALYTAILREVYLPVGDRVVNIAACHVGPRAKLDGVVEALVEATGENPHFLPILMRELAEGGRHLGQDTLQLMGRIFGLVSGIIAEGVAQGEFAPMHPALAYFSMLGPLVMFRVSAPIRERMTRLGIAELPDVDRDMLVNHLQTTARKMLARSSGVS
ncbi:MAG TPA: TetR/AcrR family transcriptional regulator [Vicinamibacterales bacterium]|jgi:AcrR family transcriptional regulator